MGLDGNCSQQVLIVWSAAGGPPINCMEGIVYDLKSVGPLKFKLVAPMPEQLKTNAMHFYGEKNLLWGQGNATRFIKNHFSYRITHKK